MNPTEAIRRLQDALEFSRTAANADEKVGYMRAAIQAALEALNTTTGEKRWTSDK